MIVFIHIPKTGGSSLRYILEGNFGVSHCHANHTRKGVFTEKDLAFAGRTFPRLRSIAGHNLICPEALPFSNPFYVTILRDPVTRVMSHYQQIARRQGATANLETMLREREELQNLQVTTLAGAPNLDKAKRFLEKQCHVTGLTEKYDLSLRAFEKLCPVRLNMHYRKRRITKDTAIRHKIQNDLRLIELIKERNRLDLELYSHAVTEVFPRLCERAGFRATDELPPLDDDHGFGWKRVVGRIYNRVVYRQLCKLR